LNKDEKILVANRGEIAIRDENCSKMGIKTVAVFYN
jgi:acetyl/propionyl-CoA carboxylase alpha subunit